jgi:gamma-glutamylaminecyclotransferase
MKVQVMVYGTLMRGERNHRQMTGARFVREVRTTARFTLVDRGAFPALLQEGATSVRGELYEVTPEHLARLDWFEGAPRLYERRTVRLADGARAQAYVQPGASLRTRDLIVSGDWRAHRKEKDRADTNQE